MLGEGSVMANSLDPSFGYDYTDHRFKNMMPVYVYVLPCSDPLCRFPLSLGENIA